MLAPLIGRTRVPALFARHAARWMQSLRSHIGELLLPLCILFAAERLLHHLWLGQPLARVFSDSFITLPALFVLTVALVNMATLPLRWAAMVVLFCINYAQYAFQSYYGRFLGEGELRLAASNPAHELFSSIQLYFSAPALLAALAATAVYAVIVFRWGRAAAGYRRTAIALLALTAWCGFVDAAMPNQAIYSPALALAATNVRLGMDLSRASRAPLPSRLEARAPQRRTPAFDVIYIVGESLRADRFHPEAYGRNVTPYLSSLRLPHVAFDNVSSHGDCTDRSVPLLMVEPAQPVRSDLLRSPSLFSYAKKSGFSTGFVSANDEAWPEFVDQEIDVVQRNSAPTLDSDRWRFRSDNEMLPIIADVMDGPDPRFLVVETYAAHWPYGDRYASCPQCRVFLPDLNGRAATFSAAHRREIVNSYDNAVLYFDQFVSRLIGGLRRSALIVLTSDHGESLGEAGRWGHCSAAVEQMLVPFMLIATDDSVARAVGFTSLAAKSSYPISHANIFPTLLEVFGYSVRDLEYSYAPSLDGLTSKDGGGRPVLVSAIGETVDAESFRLVDANRVMKP
jgi:glucan phosphoethanolaminetransferase (alkaline phosphatase superfamily)